ncbi:nucleotide exchange factor GrpE [Candidatus Adlerbacteria bacterium RIFCSPHIGHO2_02_FULL_54_18]|uniref:Protein GrpE n=2 Tax=Candidatus Adleribacteriota TaxID=1752736 RepID=A0A1F4Y1X1_9BACT|nr:MAG: nucleotide exchange factor GrpE [Candidatus Adlerbacteria bacterium RIFCSPLOWO2_01_FULL_54_21b]OGC87838.1 MAG: nucleotide exchange factor GrpE [Candidatus Adlerbacteria bacterium RIFCSPHIGHO2_02_FULL_54_18]
MDGTDEEFVPEEEGEGPAAIKRLREKVQKAVGEKQEYLEGWQRARADLANYKREEMATQGEREARAKTKIVEVLLPALDTLEMALKHSQAQELLIVHKQLIDALSKMGVERYGRAGDDFDPRAYEALEKTQTDDETKDHKVNEVHRAGFKIGDSIIRPAQVSLFINNT